MKTKKKNNNNISMKFYLGLISALFFSAIIFSNLPDASAKTLASLIKSKNSNSFSTPQSLTLISKSGIETLKHWFLSQTTDVVTETQIGQWFGPWAIATDNNAIYLGLASNLPAGDAVATVTKIDVDQPLGQKLPLGTVAIVDNSGIIPAYQDYLDDNGIHALDWTDETKSRLIVPGTDPGFTDGWNGGNIYWLDKNTDANHLLKVRCSTGPNTGDCEADTEVFPNIVHFFGSTQIGNRYYLGGSTPSGNTAKPEIWGSTNAGKSWERLYTFPNTTYIRSKQLFALKDPQNTDKYQLYSITQYNNPDSQLANKIFYSNERSATLGTQWSGLNIDPLAAPHTNIAPVTINEETGYYVDYRGSNVVKLMNDNTMAFIPFTGFTVGYKYHQGPEANYYKYNGLTTDNKYLYTIGDNNGVYRYALSQTPGSGTWELIYTFPESPTEKPYLIHYWTEKHGIIIGTLGVDANLYFMNVE
ncbi:MAG: hypothetical protein ACEQSA_01850 [Weeksellaceae bacterium]